MQLLTFTCFTILMTSLLMVPSNGQCPAPGDCNLICGSRDHIYHCNPPTCNCRCGVRPHPLFCRAAPFDCASVCRDGKSYGAICKGLAFNQCSCFC